jgi:hypothetical protein
MKKMPFILLLAVAFIGFEVVNFRTTDFAFTDILGVIPAAFGFTMAEVLAVSFCSLDLVGIIRGFTPQTGKNEPKEVWLIFGGWAVAALVNAVLTWWGVTSAITTTAHVSLVGSQQQVLEIIPVAMAFIILMIRVLLVSTLSFMIDQTFSDVGKKAKQTFTNRGQRTTTRARSQPVPQKSQNLPRKKTPVTPDWLKKAAEAKKEPSPDKFF